MTDDEATRNINRTISRVNRPPRYIEMSKVRMTNLPAEGEYQDGPVNQTPICVVEVFLDYKPIFAIVDGNHRFWLAKQNVHNARIKAWVLNECDKDLLTGSLSPPLSQWVHGHISFNQLCDMALKAHIDFRNQ